MSEVFWLGMSFLLGSKFGDCLISDLFVNNENNEELTSESGRQRTD